MTSVRWTFATFFATTLFCTSDRAFAKESPGFRITFPDEIAAKDVKITCQLAGSFGGYTMFAMDPLNAHEYLLPTSIDGVKAETLKAIIYCPGYKLLKLDRSPLKAGDRRFIAKFEKLPTVRLTGKLRLDRKLPADAVIEINYGAWWSMGFFQMIDGFPASFDLGTFPISADGTFTAEIPDFAKDKVAMGGSPEQISEIGFMIHSSKTGNRYGDAELRSKDGKNLPFKIQPSYPPDLVFNVKRAE